MNNAVLYEKKEGVAIVTLNRPERLNAVNDEIRAGLREKLDDAAKDEEVKVIIVTGAGRGVCAGADMDGLKKTTKSNNKITPEDDIDEKLPNEIIGPKIAEHFQTRFGFLATCRKPIIAAINGPCAGIGLVMTLFCDLRFAAEGAKFTTAFSRRGLIAEHGISWILPKLIGHAHAMDILFTGRVFLAEEAFKIGLINNCFPKDDFMESTLEYVKDLANMSSPRSIAVMKSQIYKAFFQNLNDAASIGDLEMEKSFLSEDFKEGVNHFMEKRAPKFTGK